LQPRWKFRKKVAVGFAPGGITFPQVSHDVGGGLGPCRLNRIFRFIAALKLIVADGGIQFAQPVVDASTLIHWLVRAPSIVENRPEDNSHDDERCD
jgi:hypothetical protein